ncbi:PREDICTED: ankyrin repeat-containing protein At5g02620-like [Ipomoea nil]|uniref:ankyrin repeat-containing protein At5g02620-like n=1 Tax=Ipomoea nil TaxID=35883 RepID=UPI000900FD5F|nr:PREDICTED: ankyrin repeat-containing protein At5g02620-like [Ipomoea nil]
MDCHLFNAAKDGNVDILGRHIHLLPFKFTPNMNTVAHVAAQFGRSQCVEEILKMCSLLLWQVNAKGETCLHIASREGHASVVRVIIESARRFGKDIESSVGAAEGIIRKENCQGDTALHLAVRNRKTEVVEFLLKEDPGFPYYGNKAREAPLYLAAERGYDDLAVMILHACDSAAYGGPKNRTALHASVICHNQHLTAKILELQPHLTKLVDEDWWSPLHFAAHFDHAMIARMLLEHDSSIAYIRNREGKTALHIAASHGHTNTMLELILQCPDCYEVVDYSGRNVLHVAVESNQASAVKVLLSNPLFNSLINEKDVEGNTPLHLLAMHGSHIQNLICNPRVDKSVYNAANLTPLDIASSSRHFTTLKSLIKRELKLFGATRGLRNVINKDDGDKEQMRKEHLKKLCETHLIVAALIATVTFTAGFTVPGGFNGNSGPEEGLPVLMKKMAFKAFFISDTVSLVLSTSAVFMYFITALYADQTKLFNRLAWAFCFTIVAIGAMVIAFVTGTYAVLPNTSGLAISSCVVGCCFFLVYFLLLKKLHFDKIAKKTRLCGHAYGRTHNSVAV